jgi:hypothetical protein
LIIIDVNTFKILLILILLTEKKKNIDKVYKAIVLSEKHKRLCKHSFDMC